MEVHWAPIPMRMNLGLISCWVKAGRYCGPIRAAAPNYGAAFAAANKNDLGGGDYRDIMAGVDYVLKTRVPRPATHGAYGLQLRWRNGRLCRGQDVALQSDCQRRAGHRPVQRIRDGRARPGMTAGTSANPGSIPQDAWRQSPLCRAVKPRDDAVPAAARGGDTTDPLGQSQEMYRALRQAGVPVDLVTYPRDDHGPLAMAIFGYPRPNPGMGMTRGAGSSLLFRRLSMLFLSRIIPDQQSQEPTIIATCPMDLRWSPGILMRRVRDVYPGSKITGGGRLERASEDDQQP